MSARLARADQEDSERERRGPGRGYASHRTSLSLCDLDPLLVGCTIDTAMSDAEHH